MLKIYGISNCDTVKKTTKWLENNNVDFDFHDFRKDGCDKALVSSFFEKIDWTTLVNKRSTTYRNLDADVKDNLSESVAFDLILEQPTLIKRPVIIAEDKAIVGFSEKELNTLL